MEDLAEWISTLLVVSVLVALFSSGISFWMVKNDSKQSAFRISTISALSSSGILALVPIAVIATEEGFTAEFFIVLVVMVVGALLMAAVVGFPAALYTTRKFRDVAVQDQI